MKIPVITCEKVCFAYANGRGALQDLNLEVEAGEFVLLTGPSGAGKSTFLRLLIRLEEPVAGIIRYEGKNVADYPPVLLRQRIGLVGQTPTLGEGSVRENLLLPFSFSANQKEQKPDDAMLLGWLERLSLADISLDDVALNLSVGQRQRLCLIRCLLLKPDVLLLDEPVSALDPESRQAAESLVEQLQREKNLTVIQVDHSGYIPEVAFTRYHISSSTLERRDA